MNGLPYYKAYPRDFVEGTVGMPFEMKCAYRVVLDLIYMQGGNLPDDARYISGLLGCSIRKWKSIRDFLISEDKIQIENDCLTNYRAVKELETLAKLQDKQRENRSRPNKNKGLQSPRSNHTEPEPDKEKNKQKRKTADAAFESDFQEVYSAFPRHVGMGAARRAYKSAIQKVDHSTLLRAVGKFAIQSKGKDKKYIPHPATWLNGERWADDDLKGPKTIIRKDPFSGLRFRHVWDEGLRDFVQTGNPLEEVD